MSREDARGQPHNIFEALPPNGGRRRLVNATDCKLAAKRLTTKMGNADADPFCPLVSTRGSRITIAIRRPREPPDVVQRAARIASALLTSNPPGASTPR